MGWRRRPLRSPAFERQMTRRALGNVARALHVCKVPQTGVDAMITVRVAPVAHFG